MRAPGEKRKGAAEKGEREQRCSVKEIARARIPRASGYLGVRPAASEVNV